MKYLLSVMIALIWAVSAQARLQMEVIEYRLDDTVLGDYLAYDDTIEGKRPGILVVHAWKGPDSFTEKSVARLAKMGYIAFAIDMYGKIIRPKDNKEAAKQSGIYRADRRLMLARANTGLEVLKTHRLTDIRRLAAIGYCFGGATALELARSGADTMGVVSFHGNLDTPDPADARNIKGKVLVLHGADDPFVKTDQVLAFQEEMCKAGVD